jgi:hypothetical protein
MKIKRTHQLLILVVLIVIVSAGLYIRNLLLQTPPTDQVLCPINYDVANEDCRVQANNPNPSVYEILPAVELQNNEVGVFRPPADKPPQLVRGIGYHGVPAKYTLIFPTNLRTVKTDRNYKDPTKCTDEQRNFNECDSSLDNVRLKGGVLATIDYEVDYTIVASDGNASQLLDTGGYANLVQRLTSFLRAGFRNATTIDPALYATGDINSALISYYKQVLGDWPEHGLVNISDIRIRSITVEGSNTSSTTLQQQQGLADAQMFATQQAVICQNIKDPYACAYTMSVFIWSKKANDLNPLPMPTPGIAPTPQQ